MANTSQSTPFVTARSQRRSAPASFRACARIESPAAIPHSGQPAPTHKVRKLYPHDTQGQSRSMVSIDWANDANESDIWRIVTSPCRGGSGINGAERFLSDYPF